MQARRLFFSILVITGLFVSISYVEATRRLSIQINDGEGVTNNRNVTLSLVGPIYAESVKIANSSSGLDDANWRHMMDEIRDWPLLGTNGTKTVYVKYKTREGEVSSIYRDSIRLELAGESMLGIDINDGDTRTDSKTVIITAGIPSNASRMRVANTVHISEENWRRLDDEFRWSLWGI